MVFVSSWQWHLIADHISDVGMIFWEGIGPIVEISIPYYFMSFMCHDGKSLEVTWKMLSLKTSYLIYDDYFLLSWARFSRIWEMNCQVTLRPLLQRQENCEPLVTAKCHFLPSEKICQIWSWKSKYFSMPLNTSKLCTST